MVLMESLSGSGHVFATLRSKVAGPTDMYRLDPLGMFSASFECEIAQMSARSERLHHKF